MMTAELITEIAGNDIMRHGIMALPQPPIKKCGVDRANIPAKVIEALSPSLISSDRVNSRETPSAAMRAPAPISACPVQ